MAESFSSSIFTSAMSGGGGVVSSTTAALVSNPSIQAEIAGRRVGRSKPPTAAEKRAATDKAFIDASQIQRVLVALRTELADNGKLYRRTLRAVKRAGGTAATEARGLLPSDAPAPDNVLPSGFVRRNDSGWATTRTGRDGSRRERAFPRYDKFAAAASISVVASKTRRSRTASGWRGGNVEGVAVQMRDPAGSIYDAARRGKHPSGIRLVRGFVAASGLNAGLFRVLLPAVIKTRPAIKAAIELALSDAQRTFYAIGGSRS